MAESTFAPQKLLRVAVSKELGVGAPCEPRPKMQQHAPARGTLQHRWNFSGRAQKEEAGEAKRTISCGCEEESTSILLGFAQESTVFSAENRVCHLPYILI